MCDEDLYQIVESNSQLEVSDNFWFTFLFSTFIFPSFLNCRKKVKFPVPNIHFCHNHYGYVQVYNIYTWPLYSWINNSCSFLDYLHKRTFNQVLIFLCAYRPIKKRKIGKANRACDNWSHCSKKIWAWCMTLTGKLWVWIIERILIGIFWSGLTILCENWIFKKKSK